MEERSTGAPPSGASPAARLESWKEIATYVKKDVTTVQRWEKREGLPVHRHLHDKRGSVYAFPAEIDEWMRGRSQRLDEEEKEPQRNDGLSPEKAANVERTAPSSTTFRPYFWVIGVAAVALVLCAYLIFRHGKETQPKITSLVVLPLKNLSGDPSQEYLADGMTESIIGRLSAIHGLRVISRTSSMHFKDTQLSAPEIAKALNVDALVEGSVIRDGNRVRVHAQLIRTATDEHFWSETYDRDLGDALSLESEVAQSIASKVEVTITGEEHSRLVAARHVAPEIYESYLKGQFIEGLSRASIEKKISYFEDAIRKDPTFAPAYLGLASAYDDLGTIFVGLPPAEIRPKVISAAEKALELDPELSDAHVLLAGIYQVEWKWSDAETEYKRALAIRPNDANAHNAYSSWLLCQGRTEEALSWAERARQLDPLGDAANNIGSILFHSHRYHEAIKELRSELAVHPGAAYTQWNLGFVLIANGQAEEAIPLLENTASQMERSPGSIELLAAANARAGHRKEALRLIDELKQRGKTSYVPAGAFINPYLALGDYDEAFVWFDRACQEHSNIIQFLKVHPFFEPVRNDPRFKVLLHRVGLDH
jgi:TolB-like protein/Tfp pilus assembly protein PilF